MPFSGYAEVIETKHYKHVSGRTASMWGAAPWTSEADRANWTLVPSGWDIIWTGDGTFGRCKPPFKTKEEADAFAAKWNKEEDSRRHTAEVMAYRETQAWES